MKRPSLRYRFHIYSSFRKNFDFLVLSFCAFNSLFGFSIANARSDGMTIHMRPAHVVTKLPAKISKAQRQAQVSKQNLSNSKLQKSDVAGANTGIQGGQGSELLRVIHASESPSSAVLASATGIVIGSRWILIPFGFVSDLTLANHDVRFFTDALTRGDGRQETGLVAIDINSGFAIFQLIQPLAPSLALSQFRVDNPPAGEVLTLISSGFRTRGFRAPSASIDRTLTRYKVETIGPIGDVAFAFDHLGMFAGMVTKRMSPDVEHSETVATNLQTLGALLRQAQVNAPGLPTPSLASIMMRKQIQLVEWQDGLMKSIFPRADGRVDWHGFDCHAELAKINDATVAPLIKSIKTMRCSVGSEIQLGGEYSAGVEFMSGTAQINDVPRQPSSIAPIVTSALGADAFQNLTQVSATVNRMTTPDCSQNDVINKHGLAVHVRFCTAALKSEVGLNDTAVIVSSLSGRSTLEFWSARLKGFNQVNSRRVIESMIDNVGDRREH